MNLMNRDHFNEAPLLFAAWTGAGNVGILSIDYLRRKLDSQLFAQIDMSRYISPDSIMVTGGMAYFPEAPQSVFYHHHNPDLVIFESNAHAGGKNDVEIIKAILDLAKDLRTPRIYTAAALPQSMSHNSPSKVLFATNSAMLIPELKNSGFEPMPDGVISGLNGIILGFAASKGIDAICLLATIPAYAGALTYPRGALSIIEAFSKLVNLNVDLGELERESREAEPMFDEVEEKIRDFFNSSAKLEDEGIDVEHEDVPKYVMEKIERLFEAAAADRSRAHELKEELDKWNLYQFYENRFLDLFEDE